MTEPHLAHTGSVGSSAISPERRSYFAKDPRPGQPDLSDQLRGRDCERNAVKPWLPAHSDELRPYQPVFSGDDLYCCEPHCRLVLNLGEDFLFVSKHSSHTRMYELLHDDFIRSSRWMKTRNRHKRVDRRRFRWTNGLPVRDRDDAVPGAWVELEIERNGERTYMNTFFTSLRVWADNVAAIARARRARWRIEDEGSSCLARHGHNIKRSFGHGSKGMANLLATLNLFAFALHAVAQGIEGPELSATRASLVVRVNRSILTRVVDHSNSRVRECIHVPLYPLAEWLAANWRCLLHESADRSGAAESSFRERHALGCSREGYHYPDLQAVSFDTRTRLTWKNDRLLWSRLEFLEREGWEWIDKEEFRHSCARLVDSVVARLSSEGVTDTLL